MTSAVEMRVAERGPFADGHLFADAGAYERIVGRAHFAVDPAGRVWEARPLGWQGAHVKDHNPGNIGIVVLGNFEVQTPGPSQLEGVRRHVTSLMRAYNVPRSRVHTHRDWGAQTACPGDTLQSSLQRLQLTG